MGVSLLTALALEESGRRTFFVSKDINARVKAAALGIKAVDYEKQKVNIDKLYAGYTELDATADNVSALAAETRLPWADKCP